MRTHHMPAFLFILFFCIASEISYGAAAGDPLEDIEGPWTSVREAISCIKDFEEGYYNFMVEAGIKVQHDDGSFSDPARGRNHRLFSHHLVDIAHERENPNVFLSLLLKMRIQILEHRTGSALCHRQIASMPIDERVFDAVWKANRKGEGAEKEFSKKGLAHMVFQYESLEILIKEVVLTVGFEGINASNKKILRMFPRLLVFIQGGSMGSVDEVSGYAVTQYLIDQGMSFLQTRDVYNHLRGNNGYEPFGGGRLKAFRCGVDAEVYWAHTIEPDERLRIQRSVKDRMLAGRELSYKVFLTPAQDKPDLWDFPLAVLPTDVKPREAEKKEEEGLLLLGGPSEDAFSAPFSGPDGVIKPEEMEYVDPLVPEADVIDNIRPVREAVPPSTSGSGGGRSGAPTVVLKPTPPENDVDEDYDFVFPSGLRSLHEEMLREPAPVLRRLEPRVQEAVDALFRERRISNGDFTWLWKRLGGAISGRSSGGSHRMLLLPDGRKVGTFVMDIYDRGPLSYLRAAVFLMGGARREVSSRSHE